MGTLNLLFKKFEDISKNPKKYIQKHIDETGEMVVGCMPLYTPEELVVAAGMLPVGVWGAKKEISEAKSYFPAFICSILQTTLENAIAGKYDMLEAMMIPNYCDSLKCMGQNFKLTVKNVKFIPVTIPQNRRLGVGKEFLRNEYERIICELEDISGNKVTEEKLEDAINLYNEHRIVMNEFIKLVGDYPNTITSRRRNYVLKSGYFINKETHINMVKELMYEIKKMDVEEFTGKRVITTGIIADSEDLLKILDDNNLAIVGDDVAHESRQYRTLVPSRGDDQLERLVNQFSNLECSTLYDPTRRRGNNIVELAKERKADGIIYFMTKFCDPEEFDYPQMKEDFDNAKLQHIIIETDKQMENHEQARTALQTFAEMI